MARATVEEKQLQREQLRLRQALAAGRMCALDYDVVEDRLTCSADTPDGLLARLNGRLSELLSRVHEEDRVTVERAIDSAIDRGDELEFEARISEAGERTRWLLVHVGVQRDAHGRAIRLVGVARDNTARREGQTLRHAQAQGERLRALGEMASGVAHDLNQSLALITGYSDMARQELMLESPDLKRLREMIEITAQAALQGGHAVRGLLTFVRSQELMADAQQIDVAELLEEAARLTAPRWRHASQAEGRPIELSVDAEPDLCVSGSASALREAITNLIFNAVDALPDGGAIELLARAEASRILI